jgi:hypothetical protein
MMYNNFLLLDELVKLLHGKERQNGMGAEAQEIRREALPQAEHSLALNSLLQAVNGALMS